MHNILASIEDIENIINDLGQEYIDKKAMILSEDDLKCHLFSSIYTKLYQRLESDELKTSDRNIKGYPIHSEIRFFDENDKLTLIPDITILQPKNLSILKSFQDFLPELSAKRFEFIGDAIIIELKFCKNKNGISKENIESYRKDIEKIKKIQNINHTKGNKIIGFFVVFDKTYSSRRDFELFLHSEDNNNQLKIIYASANV